MKSSKPTLIKGLTCPRCAVKGKTVRIPNTIELSRGPLDFPTYRCEDCYMSWHDGIDVVALIIHYSYEFVAPRKETVTAQ